MITDRLGELVRAAFLDLSTEGGLALGEPPTASFERPKRAEHGDWASNVALAVAKQAGAPPRSIAEGVARRLGGSELIDRVEVAGPGFLNFHLSAAYFHDVVRRAADPAAGFGRSAVGGGTKVNVEYVSANPTGPINVVSGRHAAVGDAIAALLEAVGYEVAREFYVNDAGRQIELFGRSVAARYLEHHGRTVEIPDEGYRGDYLVDLARELIDEVGDRLVEADDEERATELGALALDRMLEQNRAALQRFGTRFDLWFRESGLHSGGKVDAALDRLAASGLVEERDGALWFLSTRFGDDKDRVLKRGNGATTYLAGDAAYLEHKFARGFDRLIYLWGADHHGTVARLLAATEALGFERDRVEVRLVQVVTLSRGGEAVKASKRAGVLVPLDELVDEVGADAARYTFLTRSLEAPLDFDIELAKQQAPENPVYYVQYAHARICSIVRRAADQDVVVDPTAADLTVLGHPSEDALMRKIDAFEETVLHAAEQRAPQRITRYVEELAAAFSAFYRDCRVLSEDPDLSGARLALCLATRNVLASGLGLLGVGAPESM